MAAVAKVRLSDGHEMRPWLRQRDLLMTSHKRMIVAHQTLSSLHCFLKEPPAGYSESTSVPSGCLGIVRKTSTKH